MPNLFPEDTTNELVVEDVEEIDVEFGRSWKFDFEKGEFVTDPVGRVIEADPINAWVEWCKKAIHTIRFKHLIYSDDFGQEFDELIASQLTRDANESEIRRMTTECLMVSPRTESVDNFSFEWDKDRVYFSFDIYNIRENSIRITESVVMNQ